MSEEYPEPLKTGFTIYTKNACIYCTKVKEYLDDLGYAYETIPCDNYLLNGGKDAFLEYMRGLIGTQWNTFPMVFHNREFIGGYNDTVKFTAFQ